jgi:hypothetical protein
VEIVSVFDLVVSFCPDISVMRNKIANIENISFTKDIFSQMYQNKTFSVEDLDDQTKFRPILIVPYKELITFIFDQLKKKSPLMFFFWSVNLIFLCLLLNIRVNISGAFPGMSILFHSILGLVVFPVLCIPIHEILHIIPYYFSGARSIRIGMDLKQYLFYVTAHRYVASPVQFKIVAIIPFILISVVTFVMVLMIPGLWKWSLSLFLFVHATMCAGDFALLNFYYLNRKKKIYTWDDADLKIAYFYEKV